MTLYSREALIEIFGTPKPSRMAITRWKRKWAAARKPIQIKTFNDAIKFMKEHDIDPLFYHFTAGQENNGNAETYYVSFYYEEHEVFYKLHSGIS